MAYQDALRINQVDVARGQELAQDGRGGASGDAVEGRSRAIVEVDGCAGGDREGAPVDDGAQGGLIDVQDIAGGFDLAGAGGERSSGWEGGSGLQGGLGGDEADKSDGY